ncbi:Pentatricopeptide repeat-containing protein [Quillaja saponaria]|uniref:Pentatricopeptide repeat-containing protein n=1 Tax=Quillaja saponaria TaxID=32244 RepID=A0AAD7PKS7_QUISA|nr:Pentatricopeptide repeat-containing protein [Quillaja saponaria]
MYPNWFYLIRNYVSQGSPKEALLVYKHIRHCGIYDLSVVPLMLKACASLFLLNYGKAIHAESVKAGSVSHVMIGTALVSMYAKCGVIFDSHKLFEKMPEKNAVSWNAMISGYLRNGNTKSAAVLFEEMPERTEVTWNEMIDGFARSGDIVTARQLFNMVPTKLRNVVTWTVMVDGYTRNGEMEAARELFEQMPQRNFFVWSSMISGYCKKGFVMEGKSIFDRIPVRNLENWNSMISGYAQNGFGEEALEAFENMQTEGFQPDEFTVVSALSACAQLGRLDNGKEIHHMLSQKGIQINDFVLNGLVDMYAKCGELANAISIFEDSTVKHSSCWNAMISGLAINGNCKEALEFFDRMEDLNVRPDRVTFLSVLSACAHGGLVDEALKVLYKMERCGSEIDIKHYGCLVDLLGRAGRLKEAYDLIKRMPMKPNYRVLGAMLGACRIHLDMKLAEQVMQEVSKPSLNTISTDNSHYVLLSNIYAASGRWENAERLRMAMVGKGFRKTPGCSSVMFSGTENKFCARRR